MKRTWNVKVWWNDGRVDDAIHLDMTLTEVFEELEIVKRRNKDNEITTVTIRSI